MHYIIFYRTLCPNKISFRSKLVKMNYQILQQKRTNFEDDISRLFSYGDVGSIDSINLNFPLISVVIPLYNEENSIKNVLRRIPNHNRYEIVVVDDGSTDNSVKYVKEVSHEIKNPIKLIEHRNNQGYGAAILTGFKHATGDVIVTMDSDGQHEPEEIPNLIRPIINNKADIIVGSRYLGKCEYKVPLSTRIGEFCINKCLWILFRQEIGNNQSGFRAFSRKSLEIFQDVKQTNFGLCTESLFKAAHSNLKIAEIPINVRQRKYGSSKVQLLNLFKSILSSILIYSLKRFDIIKFLSERLLSNIKETLQCSSKSTILNDSFNLIKSATINKPSTKSLISSEALNTIKPEKMAQSVPKVSIIFPSYNGDGFLKKNLDSIKNLKNPENIELIVIDNNSNDSSVEIIESYRDALDLNLIKKTRNLGYAKACNIGVENAKNEFVFITNQDVIFPADFFQKLIPIYYNYNHKQEIVLSPALILNNSGKEIDYFGAKNHVLGFSYTPEVGEQLPDRKIVKQTQRCSGGTLFIKKQLFLELGGFDSSLFMYYEDTDFSMRLLRNNIKLFTTNEPYLIHQKEEKTICDLQYYLLERNRYITVAKNIDSLNKLLPFFILSETILIFQSIITKKFRLRIRIYYELLSRLKTLRIIREKSKKEAKLIPIDKLSHILDSALMGKSKNNKLFKTCLNLFNFVLKRI